MATYGVCALVAFLVVTWLLRRVVAPAPVEVPLWWKVSGGLVWLSLLLGGFAGVSALTEPLLSSVPESFALAAGGALFGAIVGALVFVGYSLALRGDTRVWKWAMLYQFVALAGDVLAAGRAGEPAFVLTAIVPLAGMVSLVLAFRDPPRPPVVVPARPVKRR